MSREYHSRSWSGKHMGGVAAIAAATLIAASWTFSDSLHAQNPETTHTTLVDEVSFSHDVQPILHASCTTCHSGADPEAGLDLTTYASARKAIESGVLLERINDAEDPMPPRGLLPSDSRQLIQQWAEQGYVKTGTERPMKTPESPHVALPDITPFDISTRGFEFLEKTAIGIRRSCIKNLQTGKNRRRHGGQNKKADFDFSYRDTNIMGRFGVAATGVDPVAHFRHQKNPGGNSGDYKPPDNRDGDACYFGFP